MFCEKPYPSCSCTKVRTQCLDGQVSLIFGVVNPLFAYEMLDNSKFKTNLTVQVVSSSFHFSDNILFFQGLFLAKDKAGVLCSTSEAGVYQRAQRVLFSQISWFQMIEQQDSVSLLPKTKQVSYNLFCYVS